MNIFTIDLEVMSRVGAQQNKTFRGRYEIHRRDAVPVKTYGSFSS